MRVFEPARIGTVELPNRILRSATFEGRCDADGNPGPAYLDLYAGLAAQGLGALITGFAFVSLDGRAMQPGQAGLETDAKVPAFRRVTDAVHRQGGRIFVQLAHAGRQTTPAATGGEIYAPSARKSPYFNHRPCRLTERQITEVITRFGDAARRAREAGFDGLQLHAAHGYLLHQFIAPAVNDRTDGYGVEAGRGIGTAFLGQVLDQVRSAAGADYPVLIKISAGDNYRRPLREPEFIALVRFLEAKALAAIEISFGTMDHAFNVFRGASIPLDAILDFNPRYGRRQPFRRWLARFIILPALRRQCAPFEPMYNLRYARLARQHTTTPLISVGGFRNGAHLRHAIEEAGIDFVSLCRPLVCEPDFVRKIRQDERYESRCLNCNRCAVLCDSGRPTRCYRPKKEGDSSRSPIGAPVSDPACCGAPGSRRVGDRRSAAAAPANGSFTSLGT